MVSGIVIILLLESVCCVCRGKELQVTVQQPHGPEGLAGNLHEVVPPLHLAPQHPRVNFTLAVTALMCAQTACKRPELCCRQGLLVLRAEH